MTKGKKEKREKKKKIICDMCGKKVIPDKNSCCPKCYAVIIVK
ncbi:MAG: hypothetical protein ABH841_02330 [Candidatus Nealsonbacteria bacterium]